MQRNNAKVAGKLPLSNALITKGSAMQWIKKWAKRLKYARRKTSTGWNSDPDIGGFCPFDEGEMAGKTQDEIGLRGHWLYVWNMPWPFRMKTWNPQLVFAMCGLGETRQHIAVLGMVVIIRGRIPRKKPAHPCCLLMIAAASTQPFADLISAFWAVPRVCNKVLMTSRGVVKPAAKAPAKPPDMQCVKGS